MLYSGYRYQKGVSKPTDSPTLLLDFLTEYSHAAICSFYFWLVLVIVTLIEPILCASYPDGSILAGQVAILVIGTILFVMQLLGELHVTWSKIPISPSSLLELWNIVYYFFSRGEYLLEGGGLLIGWGFLFTRPGLAILRCFRIFRLLWLYRVTIFKATLTKYLDPIVGAIFIERCFQVCAFAIRSLSAMGSEMFRLSKHTRGGLLLMLILFYNAFVFGAVLWVETGYGAPSSNSNSTSVLVASSSSSNATSPSGNDSCTYIYNTNTYNTLEESNDSSPCATMPSCMYLMLRLTFFDGNGLDFVYTLTQNHKFLFFLVMVYMCITGFGLINGLVGIFGTAFTLASDESFQDIDEDELKKSTALMLEQHEALQAADRKRSKGQPDVSNVKGGQDDDDDDDSSLPAPQEDYGSSSTGKFKKQLSGIGIYDADEDDQAMDSLALDLEQAGHNKAEIDQISEKAVPPNEAKGVFSVASFMSVGRSAKKDQPTSPSGKNVGNNKKTKEKEADAPGGVDMQTIAFLRRQRALPPPTDHHQTQKHKPHGHGGIFANKPLFKSSLEASDIMQLLLELKAEIADLKDVVHSLASSKHADSKKSSTNLMRRMSRMFTSKRQSNQFNQPHPIHRRLSPGHARGSLQRPKSPPGKVSPLSINTTRGKGGKSNSQRSPVNATSHPLSPRRTSDVATSPDESNLDQQSTELFDIVVQSNPYSSPKPPDNSSMDV